MPKNSGVYSTDVGDPLSASRLPDLPNAGYASRRQKETTDAIMFFMRGVERDRFLLLSIVVDGIDKWRRTAGTVWRGLLIDRDILDSIYKYFMAQAGPNPAQQLLILRGMQQQAERQRWDKRQRTRLEFQRLQRNALKELHEEQASMRRRKPHSVS